MKKELVYAKHMRADISTKKIGPVMDLIRGLALKQAKINLSFDHTKGAQILFNTF